MFYRYQTSLVTLMRLDIKFVGGLQVPAFPSPGASVVPGTPVYWGKEEIIHTPKWPKAKMFRLPEIDEKLCSDMRFPKGKEKEDVPDILIRQEWAIISDKVRKILEQVDEWKHQYFPMSFQDHEGNKLNKGTYYYLHIRRQLDIEKSASQADVDFYDSSQSYLATIQENDVLREKIEKLPFWQHKFHRDRIYFNREIIDIFKNEHVVGIEEYSKFCGSGEESLGHV